MRRGFRSLAFFLLMPLSLVPMFAIVPRVIQEYDNYRAKHFARSPDASVPSVRGLPWQPIPSYQGIPVLLYHGINDKHDVFSVSRQAFASQMAMLTEAGFHAVSMSQFDRWRHDSTTPLPSRPVLITFDDGRFDSWHAADSILAHDHFRATMFVIAGCAETHVPSCLSWKEVRNAQASGRWDIQEHAGYGHIRITINAKGAQDSYYANRGYENGRLESLSDFKSRVTSDLEWGDQRIFAEIPDYRRIAFAVPYGNYGQAHSNDRRIASFMRSWLSAHYRDVFLVFPYAFVTRRTASTSLLRIEIHTGTTTSELYCWLRVHAPGATGASPQCKREAKRFVDTANAE